MGGDGERELRPSLEAKVTARLATIGHAATISAASLRETMRDPREQTAIDDAPTSLPHISVALTEAPPSNGEEPLRTTTEPDLELGAVIGEGGMGRVLSARQRSLRREVAIKTLKRHALGREASLALLREGVVTGALEHPNIVPVHAIGCDEHGRPLLVMKRIEGVSWGTLLRDPEHPAWSSMFDDASRLESHLGILASVCNALHFAHRRGIVHRDVKPDNVMVGAFGEVYLVDWGIAVRMHARATSVVGTLAYMAPEMVFGEPVDARTDVYLLGATLHEVLTGSERHGGHTLEAVLLAAAKSTPIAYGPKIAEELAHLCNQATHLEPSQRPESALAFRQAIHDHLRHRGAISLCESALASLEKARACGHDEEGNARRQKLLHEAHFGFRQALRDWPESSAARRGMDTTIETMIDVELSQGDVAGARALLDELPHARPDLVTRIVVAEDAARARHDKEARLEGLERDLDPAVGRRARIVVVGVACSVFLVMSVYAQHRIGDQLTHRALLVFASFVLGVISVITLLARKHVLGNAYNKRLVLLAFVSGGALLVNRIFGTILDVDPHAIVVHDQLTFALVAAAGSALIGRAMWAVSALYGATAVFSLLVPTQSLTAFTGALIIVGGATVAYWRRDERRPKPR